MSKHRERGRVTEPLLDPFKGQVYVWTAKAVLHLNRRYEGVYSNDSIGAACGGPTDLRVLCRTYPRRYTARVEAMGGLVTTSSSISSRYVAVIPYTEAGRKLACELIADIDPDLPVGSFDRSRYRVRGVAICGWDPKSPRRDPPVGMPIRVGEAEYREHEQLSNALPDMPRTTTELPVTVDAAEELYQLVVNVCLREGYLVKQPETPADYKLFEASALMVDAERHEASAERLLRTIHEVSDQLGKETAAAEKARTGARALILEAEALIELPPAEPS